MNRLVILRLEGDLVTQGFRAGLEIGPEGRSAEVATSGTLPPNPTLAEALTRWQGRYHRLNPVTRALTPKGVYYDSEVNPAIACAQAAQTLTQQFNTWLQAEGFRNVEQQLRQSLSLQDPTRILVRTDSPHLPSLPWHLWDVVEQYSQTEVTFSAPRFRRVAVPPGADHGAKVKILAILGHQEGIDVDCDRALLADLPDAAVTFLVEPHRRQLTDQLWNQPWDILFFAGHSETTAAQGRISINPTDHLTLDELTYGLRRAIVQGLQLAIFNSCDGLGLAHALAPLNLPHMIVMREPIPDPVAQTFLTSLLQSFAAGNVLHLALREARERLQGLEGEFPCASWLPVLYQTGTEPPATWETLRQPRAQLSGGISTRADPPLRCSLKTACLASLAIAALTLGLRSLGVLQRWELQAFDRLQRQRPAETLPRRILLVEATEADINTYGYPLPDAVLAEAIAALAPLQPRVIGLDIFRPRPLTSPALQAQLAQQENLVALCSVGQPDDPNRPGIAPPEGVPELRLGFSNVAIDADQVLRRQLLFLTPDPSSPCATRFSLSALMALHYLSAEGIEAETLDDNHIQLGSAQLQALEPTSGGYHNLDSRGFQMLLNYADIQQFAQTIPLSALLAGDIVPGGVPHPAVLIGVTAPISNPTDYFLTPESKGQWPQEPLPGVRLQAQMLHQLMSAALDGRSLLRPWPRWADGVWVIAWGLVGAAVAGRSRRLSHWSLALGLAVLALYTSAWGLLIIGWWMPLVPAALALVAASSVAPLSALSGKSLTPGIYGKENR
jgi:CHASE2 domain-containing sensor protein